MEPVNVHITRLEELIIKLDDLIDSGKPVPFSPNRVSVERAAVFELIDSIRPIIDDIHRDLPSEIIQAKRVLSDSDKIITDARNKAKNILSSAEDEAEKLISEHNIAKAASEQAAGFVEEAKKSARELRINAIEYADEVLAKTESIIREAMDDFVKTARSTEEYLGEAIDIIYENRQELRPKK